MKMFLMQTEGVLEELLRALDFSSAESFFREEFRMEADLPELIRRIATEGLDAIGSEEIVRLFTDGLFYEVLAARPMFFKIFFFVLLFSLVQKLLGTRLRYVSSLGYFVVYGVLFVFLLQTFLLAGEIAFEGMQTLHAFIKALIPTYAGVLIFSGKAFSGAMMYELAFFLVYLVENGMQFLLIPVIHAVVLVIFLNHLFEEDKLSKLAGLLESAVGLCLKLAFAAVTGIGVIESMLTTAKDRVAGDTVLSGLAAIPGIGNLVNSTGEVLLGCALLIKNSVGVVALLFLILVSILPVLKIGGFVLMYQLLAVLLQPIADPRITDCVHGVARGCGLYFKIALSSACLFFLLFSMIGVMTG